MREVLKTYRKVRKLPSWLYHVVAGLIRLSKLTMRFSVKDPHGAMRMDKLPYVTVTWHNRLLFFPAVFSKEFRARTRALISPSRDGQYVSDLVGCFGVGSVRGSSNKRAAAALREALETLRAGNNVSVTPDGPRGPKYKMSLGPVILASMTGAPLLPIAVNASRYWEIPSWDRFQIPKPGARLELVLGEPLHVPPGLDEAGMERWRALAEERLMLISCPGGQPV